jgi:signal transduction histidine kinase
MQVKLKDFLNNLTLSQRFMLYSLVVLLAGMAGIGLWVQKQIETGVIHRTGATTALYVDSFVAPNLQELGSSPELLPEHVETLRTLLDSTAMGKQIVAFKVWDTRGRLLYSTDQSITGKTYPMTEGMLRARLGEVASRISQLEDEENASLKAAHGHLLETYSPVWLSGTDQVLAVAEFYQIADDLDREIDLLKRQSWLVVGLAILLIYLLLSGLVHSASNTILRQKSELAQRVAQLTSLLAQNQELHERVRRASASVALLNESYLRRVGSELHDGPAQDLGLSILKLDALAGRVEAHPQGLVEPGMLDQLTGIRTSLQSALKEMRGIAGGLSLPQLNDLGLPETVFRVVRAHERQTGTRVSVEMGDVPVQISLPLRITVYRLVQEALNNAFRHANGAAQQVRVRQEQDQLVVEVSDRGPGFELEEAARLEGHLGLSGMRERVESLGGQFKMESASGQGTLITARLPIQPEEGDQR